MYHNLYHNEVTVCMSIYLRFSQKCCTNKWAHECVALGHFHMEITQGLRQGKCGTSTPACHGLCLQSPKNSQVKTSTNFGFREYLAVSCCSLIFRSSNHSAKCLIVGFHGSIFGDSHEISDMEISEVMGVPPVIMSHHPLENRILHEVNHPAMAGTPQFYGKPSVSILITMINHH